MPLRIEKPVKSPIVPPISPSWATKVTFTSKRHLKCEKEHYFPPSHPSELDQRLMCQSRCAPIATPNFSSGLEQKGVKAFQKAINMSQSANLL